MLFQNISVCFNTAPSFYNMSRNSCKGCEYSQKCELVKMTKEERKRHEEIEEEIKKYIGGNPKSDDK